MTNQDRDDHRTEDPEAGGNDTAEAEHPPRFSLYTSNRRSTSPGISKMFGRPLSGLTRGFAFNFAPKLLPKGFNPLAFTSAHFSKIVFPDHLRESVRAMLREGLPPNWPTEIDIDTVITVVQDDGLPLVWVPRTEILEEVLGASDREERIAVLLARADDVMHDCRDLLPTLNHSTLANQLPLVEKVLEAFEQGHTEAAQALAVVVTETVVARVLGNNYKRVRELVWFDPDQVSLGEVRVRAALAPMGPFFTVWYPNSGNPAPTALSRHVTVHQADLDHYTPGNALVAVMLAVSGLRAIQEFLEL